jgi:hypothetical protein
LQPLCKISASQRFNISAKEKPTRSTSRFLDRFAKSMAQ